MAVLPRILSIAALAGCASAAGRSTVAPVRSSCPTPPDSTGPERLATVLVDGRLVAANVKARLERSFPESYQLEEPEPPALKAIPAAEIDLIQFARGPEAEREYGLCPGVVAFLITTKRSGSAPR